MTGDCPRRARIAHRRLVLAGLVVALSLCGWGCRRRGVEYDAVYHLIDRFESAVGVKAGRRPLAATRLEIGFDQRRALMQHARSAYRFEEVPSGPRARLLVAPALNPKAWSTGSDGAGFEISCLGPAGAWKALLKLDLPPPGEGESGAWHEQDLSLEGCASPSTSLELRTTCGPAGNCRADQTAWGEPRVVHPGRFEPRIRRLAVVVSIDTLRPERLGLYGAERPTSPQLGRLAADGVVFETTVAAAPWTVPSHASLLSSTHPAVHGATTRQSIDPGVPMLAEILRRAGWSTAGIVDTPWLGRFGFDRGYDHYDAESVRGMPRRGVSYTCERLIDWLADAAGDAFVFWHVMDVHGPYGAPAPFGGRFRDGLEVRPDGRLAELSTLGYHDYLALHRFRSFDDLLAAYDEGIAAVDAEIGRVLDLLRRADLYDEALIVVTSDHGESFHDHGVWVGHGLFLTEDEIRVPLIVKLPGNRFAGRRVESMVRLVDLAPTVLDVLGVPPPPSFEGLSLVDPEPGVAGALPRAAFGASSNNGSQYVRTDGLKLITPWEVPHQRVVEAHLRPREPAPILPRLDDGEQVFDLRVDPREATNLAGDASVADEARQLRELVRRHTESVRRIREGLGSVGQETEFTPEELRQLDELGYLDRGTKDR